MDFLISDSTPIAALTVGQLKELLPDILLQSTPDIRENNSTPDIFGKRECCELTGFKINTINKFVSERKIPHYKKGRKVIFKKKEVIEWLLSNRMQTANEFIQENDEKLLKRKGGRK